MAEEDKKWMKFFDMMREGRIPYKSDFYVIEDYIPNTNNQQGSMEPTIQLVTPTQQQVEQAKLQLMHNISARIPKQKRTGKKRTTVAKKPVKRQAPNKSVRKSTKRPAKHAVKRPSTTSSKVQPKKIKKMYKF